MNESDIREFVTAYRRSRHDLAQIRVDDRNAQYRQRVISFVCANPSLADRDLLRDLVEHECLWSRLGDIDCDAIGILLSRLLELGSCEELDVLLRAVCHNMDLDGHLLSGGLVLSAHRQAELLAFLDKHYSSLTRTAFTVARGVVDGARPME